MITEMKKAFKMLKYCFQPKMNCFFGILITLIGIFFLGISSLGSSATISGFFMGSLYLVLGPSMISQALLMTLYSNMVKSSPRARFLELMMADLWSVIISIAGFTLIILYTTIINTYVNEVYSPGAIFAVALTICILLIYYSMVYKLFLTSIFVMAVPLLVVFCIFTILDQTTRFGVFPLSMTVSCLLGYVFIVISLMLSALLRRCLYRLPLSKMASGSKLRKLM